MNRNKYFEHLKKIKEAYRDWKPRTSPHQYYDWISILTPIEMNVWNDIRFLGLRFYPQFPVGRYFVDFADPERKIATEVDGQQWHNKEKDAKRQKEIENMGWRVIRIKGKKTFRLSDDFFTDEFEDELQSYDYEEQKEMRKNKWQEYTSLCSEGILRKLIKKCSISPSKN